MAVGPRYADLTPRRGIPVYPDLLDRLAAESVHPDPEIAHALATCSGFTYANSAGQGDSKIVATMMARMGLPENRCHPIELSVDAMYIDSTAFLVQSRNGQVVILAYRGTEPLDPIDWLTDIDLDPEIYSFAPHGLTESYRVHSGFYRSAMASSDRVISTLHRALRGESILEDEGRLKGLEPLKALYLTGHSLGGAVAAMMAIILLTDPEYKNLARRLKAVYTFGQPMLAEPKFAKKCEELLGDRMIRYIHRDDPVPHVPPRATGHFQHFGREYVYHDGGQRSGSPSQHWKANSHRAGQASLAEFPVMTFGINFPLSRFPVTRRLISYWNRFARSLDFLPVRPPLAYSIDDHAPHHYIAKLATNGVTSELNR